MVDRELLTQQSDLGSCPRSHAHTVRTAPDTMSTSAPCHPQPPTDPQPARTEVAAALAAGLCALGVTGPGDTERKYPGWSADAYWQVGWWMIRGVDTSDALTCTTVPSTRFP